MTESWTALLDAAGARRDASGIHSFAPAAENAEKPTSLFALDYLGCLLVSGPDARKFLQGQVTCDMDQVTEDRAQAGAHCNTKGRMVFTFHALQFSATADKEACIALIMPRLVLARAEQALAKFIVFSKAKLAIADSWHLLGLAGPDAAGLVGKWLPDAPSGRLQVVQNETGACLQIGEQRFLCLVGRDSGQPLWRNWAADCRLQGYGGWFLANIREGLGEVLPGAEEEFIPQMLNMQVTGGLSFTKGCYIGQEVVARMQYLGKLKRHMRHLSLQGDALPPPGSPVYSGERESTQSVGNVVVAAGADQQLVELLAVTTDSAFDNDSLFLDAEKTRKLQPLSLPYDIPAATRQGS